jgi:hypothetical protein
MNAFQATETLNAKSESVKVTTTLYDLLDDLNTKFFGPQWEHITYPEKKPLEDGRYSLATQKINRMFESGQITFIKPHTIQNYLMEL